MSNPETTEERYMREEEELLEAYWFLYAEVYPEGSWTPSEIM